MFDKIRTHQELKKIICDSCSENNASVEFDDSLKNNFKLDDVKVLVLKPDSFYNTKNFATPPKSLDCLILVNCLDKEHYDLYLIELKDVKRSKHLKSSEIFEKFKTMIDDFFIKFDDIFNPVNVNYGKIEFYLICPYPKLSEEEYRKKVKGFELDINSKLLRFYSKAIPIKRHPSLTIMPC